MKTILFMLLALTLLTSCSLAGTGAQILVAQSNKPRNTSPASSPSDQSRLVADNAAFAFDLYRVLSSKPGNLFLSPYSISTALVMAQAGARGQTQAQINKALHFTLPSASLHQSFNALQLELNKREQNQSDANQKDFQLKVTNALWGEKTYTFKAEFLDLLAENYGAGLKLVDFKTAPEPSRQTINAWVSDQTEQKIKDLLPQGSIDSLTRLVLTNAIYFKADWSNPFTEKFTQPAEFTLLDGKKTQVQMMATDAKYMYAKGIGYQAIELPYKSNKLSMFIILPDEGKFSEVETSLNGNGLNKAFANLELIQVNLKMPKFTFETSSNLVDSLEALGMTDAFSAELADFSGIDGTRDLFISHALHKAFISVDEKGTEAAAATALVFQLVSMPMKIIDLTIDRPFLFYIFDKQSGTLLFMGRLVNPG